MALALIKDALITPAFCAVFVAKDEKIRYASWGSLDCSVFAEQAYATLSRDIRTAPQGIVRNRSRFSAVCLSLSPISFSEHAE